MNRKTSTSRIIRIRTVLVAALVFAAGDQSAAGEWGAVDAGFANPPAEFRLIQYSGHDGALLPVTQMAEAGIGGVNLFMQSSGYLQSEQAWTNVENNILAVKAAGLQLWMADDNGYPSGMAGGRVVEANPAHESRCLIQVSTNGTGPVPFQVTLPADAEKFVHAFLYPVADGEPVLDFGQAVAVQNHLVTGTGLLGNWTLRAYALQVNDEGTQATGTASGFSHNGRYPNLLDPAAAESFVARTHEEYARRFGPLPGKIDGFYSNEPNLMSTWFTDSPPERPGGVTFLPWADGLPARFQQDHGYSLLSRLPALYGGTDTSSKLVRRHFYKTVGAMLAENFSQRVADWAAGAGIRSAGHPLQEEDLFYHVINYGDMFRFMEPIQVPTCDMAMPDRGATWNYYMPKFLSSIGQFKNRTTVAGLLDPIIYRPSPNLTPLPDDFRRIVNMAVFSGVNQFHTYLYWNQYDPALYRGMNEYAGRLSLALRGARNAATVGVYYPIETFQAGFVPSPYPWARGDLFTPEWQALRTIQNTLNNTAQNLCKAGIDFNWVHGDWIRDAVIENGCLVVGSHRYSSIVLPRIELLPLAVANKLQQFEQAGGKIVLVNRRPVLGDSSSEHSAVAAIFAGDDTVSAANLVAQLGAVLPPDFELRVQAPPQTGGEQEFFSARFTRDGRRVTYLVNNSTLPVNPTLTLADGSSRRIAIYNPLDGSITNRLLPGNLKIAPSSSLLVLENPATIPAVEYPIAEPVLNVVNGNFSDLTAENRLSPEWFSGIPAGWSGGINATYAVATLNGVAYANLGELTTTSPFAPITQDVGTVQVTSDIRLSFTLTNFSVASSTVGVALYGPGGVNLGSANFTGPGTYTHTVEGVAPGTAIQIAFWGTSAAAPMGLTGVGIESFVSESNGLSVANGTFEDFSGLAVNGISSQWRDGVPLGWSSETSSGTASPTFSIYTGGGTASVANLSQLGQSGAFTPLYQTVGTMDAAGKVTVFFEISNDWTPSAAVGVGAAIYQVGSGVVGTWTPLATGTFNSAGLHSLVADVAAGTPLAIAFWNFGAASAGLDNVSVAGSTAATFAAWQSANGTNGAFDGDHDHDGVRNGIEYFLGGNANTTGFTPLPAITDTGGQLSITWTKAAAYNGSHGSHFWIETSDSLTGAWTKETNGGNVIVSGNDVTYTFPSPPGSRKFARLVVTGP